MSTNTNSNTVSPVSVPKDLLNQKPGMYRIDPAAIAVKSGFNIRRENDQREERINQLQQSILAQGILNPLRVRAVDGQIELISGHTRLEAVRRINENSPGTIVTVPVVPEAKNTSDADRNFSLYTDNDQQNITAIEKADLFNRMINIYGWTVEQIAAKAGITVKQVNNLMELNGVSNDVKELIEAGSISATSASQIIRKEGADKGGETIKAEVAKAKDAGKAKATAKTMKPAKPATNFVSDLLSGKTSSPAPAEAAPAKPVINSSPDKYRHLVNTMLEVLNMDDPSVIHEVIRETLKQNNELS